VDAVVYHGATLLAANSTHTSNFLLITLPAFIDIAGTLDSITVNYHGTPIAPGSPVPSGYNFSLANKAIYTLDEAFTASTWWPCHDSLTDKIDSVDLIITTPSAYRAAANGLGTETISGTDRICTWKTRYRIATYLINFAAADYVDYQYNISTGGKTLPVHNYLYSADNTNTYKTATNFIQTMLPVYVSLFNADYPFLDEKYGIADCYGNWGALEVQSMTFCATSSITSNSILAHELAHQWFGDKLTTNDWHQIWLNEGFAQYCQSVIYPENLLSVASASSSRTSLKNSVTTTSTTYVSNISSAQTIFVSSASLYQPYEKGAMTLSMLRAWLGDTKFFIALHNYVTAPGISYNFTSVDSLQKYMQPQTVNDLSGFFASWVYKKGRASYVVNYQYVTNGVYIQLTQSLTSAGAGYFDMPVPIQIKNSTGLDTTITVIDRNGVLYNSETGFTYGTNMIYYKLSATPTVVPIFDPKAKVLAVASSINVSNSLNSLIVLQANNINFTARAGNGNAKLNYEIETSEDIHTVILEKSNDGKTFTVVAEGSPMATANNKFHGEFYDKQLGDGVSYYRINVIFKSGKSSYSTVKSINGKPGAVFKILPDPVGDYFTISLPSTYLNNSNDLVLKIFNSEGKLVQLKQMSKSSIGSNIRCESTTAGIYHVIIENEKRQQITSQFLKQ
nr:T9SS type A sorting domain-containing protein [Bacteroidota bacterium]